MAQSTLNLADSNAWVSNKLRTGEPFMVARLGIGAESYMSYGYAKHQRLDWRHMNALSNNAGIYTKHRNPAVIAEYCREYSDAFRAADAYAAWDTPSMKEIQGYYASDRGIPSLCYQSIEPFYACTADIPPWTHDLRNKSVLVVNPFVDSMQRQLANGFRLFADRELFYADQKFVWYKPYNTAAGNWIDADWRDTIARMKHDISGLEFDVALLACGGYGLPLCRYIRDDLRRSAIYVGGGLQLMFGVMGKRWEHTPYWTNHCATHHPRFIRPSGNEILRNMNRIEGGCYW